jgi:nitrogen regulatory protein P-II 1
MKKIEAIIRPSKLEVLKDALTAAGVKGMTISQVKGFGNQYGWKEYFRGNEILVNLLPKVKFEIVTTDERVDSIVDLIIAETRTDEVGDGKIFVYPLDEVVRIRTGERGNDAI